MPLTDRTIVTTLFDIFPDPVILADPDKMIVRVNEAACQQFGFTADEMVGQPTRLIYASDEDYQRCMGTRSSAPKAGDAVDSVYAYRKKDTSVFTGRFRYTRLFDDEGKMEGLLGILHDISDYLELDMENQRIREMLDTALAVVPEGFAIFDRNERIIVFNEAYRKICGPAGPDLKVGMTAEEIILAAFKGGHYPDAMPDSEIAREWIDSRLYDFRHPDGKAKVFPYANDRWLRVENTKTLDGNTVALRIDVTELKQTELALNRQRLEYFTLLQSLPDFITRISRDKRYTFVNDHYARFMNMTPEDLIGRPFLDFVPLADRVRVFNVLNSLSRDEPLVTAEQRRLLADGSELWIFWSNIAIFDGDELVEFVTVGRDITRLKQQQARIERQRVELERKNEALNQFTATVSHDLKAPLRHISMFSEMIVDEIKEQSFNDVAVYAGHLRQSARRMDQLIESLLDYSHIAYEIEHRKPVQFADVVSDAILNLDSFIREAGARIELGTLPEVTGDAELLKRLAQNLIGNAIKYHKPGVAPVVQIHGDESEEDIRVIVEDNGIGIDPRFAEKVFDVFQRLHRDETVYAGTGIGLALAKRIIESHNGTISLDTTFSEGARFVMVFPKMPFSDKGKQQS